MSSGSLHRPIPWLDRAFMVTFIVEIGFVIKMFKDDLWLSGLFVGLLLATHVAVESCKWFAGWAGDWISEYAARQGMVDKAPLANKVNRKKWQEQSWQLMVHAAMTGLEMYCLIGEPWWEDPVSVWSPGVYEQVATQKFSLKFLFYCQLAIWMYTCFMHVFVHERVKDYYVMYAHHVATISLVLGAGVLYQRIGLIIIFVHDSSDVFIDLMKMVNYLKLDGRRGWYATEISYVACIVTWMYMRLWEFPTRALPASTYWAYTVAIEPYWTDDKTLSQVVDERIPSWFLQLGFLALLQVLHIWWTFLLLRIGYKVAFGSVRSAAREEYEGYSDGEDEPATGKPARKRVTGAAVNKIKAH